MNWFILVWSMAGATCLTLAWVHSLVWWQQRRESAANFLFALAAVSTAALAAMELWLQLAESPEEYRLVLRWAYVPFTAIFLSLVAFVRAYLKAGRWWLFWSAIGVRCLALILNFSRVTDVDFQRIVALLPLSFFGQSQVFQSGVIRPTVLIGLGGQLLVLAFVADAAVTAWRRGDRQQALVVGGGILFFTTAALVHIILLNWRLVVTPVMASIYFSGIMTAMGAELSYLVARSRRLEVDLRDSQVKAQLAATAAKLALWDWSLPEDRFSFTPEGRLLHGFPPERTITLDIFLATVAADGRASVRQALQSAAERGEDLHADCRIELPNGAVRWLELQGKIGPASPGRPPRMLGLSLDITERKQAEESLRQSERFSRTVLDSLRSNIAILDRAGKIVAVNEPWDRFCQANGGATSGLGIGANYLEVCRGAAATGDSAAQRTVEGLQAVLEGGSMLFELEYPCHSPAEARWFMMRVVPLASTAGGAVVSHTDISHLRVMQLEKDQLRRELEHTGRVSLLGELSGSLAHELNQPLAAILANAQAANRWMAKGVPDLVEVKAILEDIIAEDKRAGEIVSRVRALARKATPERKLVDLNQVVRDTAALMRSELIAADLPLRLELDPALPPVRGGQVELQQTLLNLLLNGLQAQAETDRGRRSLTVTTRRAEDQVIIAVRDGGPGLSDEVKARIFESFFTTKQTGMGLGLALCRRTAENHGGRLSAENHPDGGAVFSLSLPVSSHA